MKIFGALTAAACSLLLARQASALPADNKIAASNAMTEIFTRQDPSAVERYFTSPYQQHNTRIPNGLEALKQLAQLATTWPGVHTTIRRALADGDLVVLQSEYWNLLNRHQTAVAFDLFRFDQDGKIVEHWDALEPLAVAGATGRSQFDGATKIRDWDKTDLNKAVALAYIDEILIARHMRDKGKYLASRHFVEHQPTRPRTFAATQEDLSGSVELSLPDLRYVARHRIVAEGNFVFVQGEGRLEGDKIVEIYDLFRLSEGKIVEHWSVHAPVAPASQWANSNGPF